MRNNASISHQTSSLITLGLLACALPALADMPKSWPKMSSGYMETKATFNGTSMPAMGMCMTDTDMQASQEAAQKDNQCTVQKNGQTGNTYFVEMACKNPDTGKPMQMRIDATLVSANQLKSKMVSTENGKVVFQSEQTITRIRDCTKAEEAQTNKMKSGTMTKEDIMSQMGGSGMSDEESKQKIQELMNKFKDMKR